MTLEVIVTVLLLAGAIGLGVAAFIWARNWRRRLDEEPTIEAQIESYRTMLNEGLIDDEEYDRIVAHLKARSDFTPPPGEPRPAGPPPDGPPPGGAPPGGTPSSESAP